MDSNILSNNYKLSEKQIEKYKEQLKKAVPYTEEEISGMWFDDWEIDFDLNRMRAYNAQKALRKAGLL